MLFPAKNLGQEMTFQLMWYSSTFQWNHVAFLLFKFFVTAYFCVFFNSFGIITLAKLFCLLVTSRLSMTWMRWCVFFFCDFHLFCRFFKKFLFQGILSRPKLYWPAVNQQHLCIMSIFSSKMSLTLKARGHNRRQFCCISKFLAEFFRISMQVSFQLVSI